MWRWVTATGYLLLALPLAVACGGNVEGGSHEPKESEPTPQPSEPASDPDSGTDNPDADIDLGDCTLGKPENRDDRCYETREMACNCACPRSRNSQCASGFDDGPDGHVWVACN